MVSHVRSRSYERLLSVDDRADKTVASEIAYVETHDNAVGNSARKEALVQRPYIHRLHLTLLIFATTVLSMISRISPQFV